DMIERHGVDAFRYFLMAGMSLGQDANFSEKIFVERYNADLANDLGNLTSRVISMLKRNYDGIVPPASDLGDDERALVDSCLGAASAMADCVANMQLDSGLATVLAAVREGNRYFDRMRPWTLAKEGRQEELGRVLRNTMECLRIASGLLYPVMPNKMMTLRRALGMPEESLEPEISALNAWNRLVEGSRVGDLKALFPRVETAKEDAPSCAAKPPQAEKKDSGKKAKAAEPVGIITIDDVGKVVLKTAEIVSAERIPEAVKLLKLSVRLGEEKRQIVAGIAEHYAPEELVGRTIVVVANLKPAVLRGVESEGMLLAAKAGKTLRLVTLDGPLPSGASVG
ncbi:MAG TPA: methionine--tRNA ligase subunit beta, partial [Lentisphaeria bacterium]|nr:methionine--tRNA ligase subunit beta [Lentisphaeria bacterium]